MSIIPSLAVTSGESWSGRDQLGSARISGKGGVRISGTRNVDMRREGIDVGEGRTIYAGCWVAIMQQLAHVASTLPHDLKPALGDRPQLT